MSAELPLSIKTRRIVASMTSMEITRGGFRVSVVLPISSEEKEISGWFIMQCSRHDFHGKARLSTPFGYLPRWGVTFIRKPARNHLDLPSNHTVFAIIPFFCGFFRALRPPFRPPIISSFAASSGVFAEFPLFQSFFDEFEEVMTIFCVMAVLIMVFAEGCKGDVQWIIIGSGGSLFSPITVLSRQIFLTGLLLIPVGSYSRLPFLLVRLLRNGVSSLRPLTNAIRVA
ncbi:hypothetical protein PIB30_062535 [Stylosanthes scabra]|uniref:Uncharacterized protein n=1 Tax=Stylosanthes scabra TaxID=79078 RepID=A0ABU6SL95_9FABA|nr:hypothetical protein [Stylosanthes scabra]